MTGQSSRASDSAVARRRSATSAGDCGIIAIFATSAPASRIAASVVRISGTLSVAVKLCCEATTAAPCAWTASMRSGAPDRAISTSTAAVPRAPRRRTTSA
ncbi:Uncharacterised protein [Mycobacteroides abscessus subsp. abscessus]|nr:Uncharacterised protein [Mycobacteroides abscessus subsp. abscessus]